MRTTEAIGIRVAKPGQWSSFLGSLRLLPVAAMGLIDRMAERRRSRIALLELNDEQLKDIGVSRADAWREGVRPFWK